MKKGRRRRRDGWEKVYRWESEGREKKLREGRKNRLAGGRLKLQKESVGTVS